MTAASAAGTGGTYGLPYMTGSPTELTASPQQLWNAQGKRFFFFSFLFIYVSFYDLVTINRSRLIFFGSTAGLGTGLPAISEDYGAGSKSTGTVTHQALPGFSQPFCGRASFRGYSPSYPTQQSNAGVGAGTVEPSSWNYGSPSNDTLATQYAAPSRRQPVNPPSTPAQHQLTATASLSASKYIYIYFYIYCINSLFFYFFSRSPFKIAPLFLFLFFCFLPFSFLPSLLPSLLSFYYILCCASLSEKKHIRLAPLILFPIPPACKFKKNSLIFFIFLFYLFSVSKECRIISRI